MGINRNWSQLIGAWACGWGTKRQTWRENECYVGAEFKWPLCRVMNECFLLFLTPRTHTHRIKTLTQKPACVRVGTKNSPSFCEAVKRWGHRTHNEQPVDPLCSSGSTGSFHPLGPGSNVIFGVSVTEEEAGWHTPTKRNEVSRLEGGGTGGIASSELQKLIFWGTTSHQNVRVGPSVRLPGMWVWMHLV